MPFMKKKYDAHPTQYCKCCALSNLMKGTFSHMSLNLQAMDSG